MLYICHWRNANGNSNENLLHTYLVQFSHSVVSNSLWPHEPQHTRPPCPSLTPGVHPNPCPLSRWCHPTTSSSVVPFSSRPQSSPASGSFPVSQLFASGGQSTGVSASASARTHLLEWPKSGTLAAPCAGKDVEQRECSFIVGGKAECTATLEDSFLQKEANPSYHMTQQSCFLVFTWKS